MKLELQTKFDEGDRVYHISDVEQSLMVVTGHLIQGTNVFVEISGMDGIRYLREFELEHKATKNNKVTGFQNSKN